MRLTVFATLAAILVALAPSASAQLGPLRTDATTLTLTLGALTPASPPGSYDGGASRRELELDIEALRQEEAEISNAGPVLMMIVGYVLAPLVLVGPLVLVAGASCDSSYETDCGDATTAGLVMTGIGAAGAALGIAGLVMAVNNGNKRNLIRGRIRDKKDALKAMSFDLRVHPNGGGIALAGAF